MEMQQKVALITGGASGLGAASARMLVEAGGRVVLVDVDQAGAEAFARELGSAALPVGGDVGNPEQMEGAIALALERFGRLDIALNCAGIGGSQRVVGKEGPVALEWFTRIIRVNLIGTFNVIRLTAAAMARNAPDDEGERGVIINTASTAAYEGQIGQAAYAASKGGVVGMTLPIARELAQHGIRTVTIAPGSFDTPLLARVPQATREALEKSVPFPQRLGRPEEFARLVRAIIENPYLNGEVIRLDGALRMTPR